MVRIRENMNEQFKSLNMDIRILRMDFLDAAGMFVGIINVLDIKESAS